MKRPMTTIAPFLLFAWVLFMAWVAWGYFAIRGVDEPAYTVLSRSDAYEVREYPPMLVAQVAVDGPWPSALERGFSVLAAYIFGDNIGSSSIAMTAPVGIEPDGERIAMTAPVTLQEKGGQYLISFIMPAAYTTETLPRPNNPLIRIVEVPASVMAVSDFSGWVNEERARKMEDALRAAVTADGRTVTGAPRLAQYNPPFTPPFLRRNEIMIPIRFTD